MLGLSQVKKYAFRNQSKYMIFKQENKRGVALLYAIFFLSIVLVIVFTQADTLLAQLSASRREERTAKALSAANTAVNCVSYYDKKEHMFDTTEPVRTRDCGVGTMTGGGINAGSDCVAHTYNFRLDAFENGSCADVMVTTVPVPTLFGTEVVVLCDLQIEAHGFDTCNPNDTRVVKRIRLESQ